MTQTALEIIKPQEVKRSVPVSISFRNISYQVQTNAQNDNFTLPFWQEKIQKQLLHELTGHFKPGQVTAIMGPSGSGKTTLLNILACRIPQKDVTGEILINNKQYTIENFGDFGNYVMQRDVLFQTMTVRETLEFAADLKLNVSSQEKKRKIETLLNKLKLDKCADVLIGGPLMKGISGGEKKRTSIAFEVISNPSVLILDEPTSGLDSLTSFIIIQYLKDLAINEGKTIIMTIHQPNAQIYALFDRLLLLVEGKLIYQGSAKETKDYFAQNFGLVCPQFHNPADFFMSIMHQQAAQNRNRFPAYFQAYQKYLAAEILQQIAAQSTETVQKRNVQVGGWKALLTLIHRDYLNAVRNPFLIHFRIVSNIVVTTFTAGVFCKFTGEYTSLLNWRALSGFLFIISVGIVLLAMTPVSLVFPSERGVFLKEESSKLYGTFAYFFSRSVIQIPYSIIFPFIQTLIVYWFAGLSSTATQFFIGYLIAFCLTFSGNSVGLILGSMCQDSKSVSILSATIFTPLIIFAGFFKNFANLPPWIGWLQYLTPIKYGFQAFTENQVQFASASLIDSLNFTEEMWLSIGLLAVVGVGIRILSLYFLWRLRGNLQ